MAPCLGFGYEKPMNYICAIFWDKIGSLLAFMQAKREIYSSVEAIALLLAIVLLYKEV